MQTARTTGAPVAARGRWCGPPPYSTQLPVTELADKELPGDATVHTQIIRRDRRDALPEGYDYQDTGCDVSPTCLNCPLAVCKYDMPGAAARYAERQEEMIALFRRGLSSQDIAARMGITYRSVNRALETERHQCRNDRRPARSHAAQPEPAATYPEYTQLGFWPGLTPPRFRGRPRQRKALPGALREIIAKAEEGELAEVVNWLRDFETLARGIRC